MPTPSGSSKPRRRSSSSSGTADSISRNPPSSSASLVFRVVEIDSQDGDFSATLWMPQSAMLSASFSASELVFVTIYSESHDSLGISKAGNLDQNHHGQFDVAFSNSLENMAETFGVIAATWPSGKLKEGIRISKQLAYALGCVDSSPQVQLNSISCSKINTCKDSRFKSAYSLEVDIVECNKVLLKISHSMLEDLPRNDASSSRSSKAPCPVSQGGSQGNSRSRKLADSMLYPQMIAPHHHMSQPNEYSALTSILGDENSRTRILLERLAGRLLHGRYLLKGNCVCIPVCGHNYIFEVVDGNGQSEVRSTDMNNKSIGDKELKPAIKHMPTLFHIGSKTLIKFELPVPATQNTLNDLSQADGTSKKLLTEHALLSSERFGYSALGGLSEQIFTLREIITYSLLHPERLLSIGLQPARGVLLHGPPGTGKTSLALATATETGVKFFSINGPEIISEYYGESEAALRAVFAAAHAAAPAVVFIDELDAIAPQRTEESEHLGQRLVATLLTVLDGSEQVLKGVLVIAATNRVEAVDPALRRPGRFDREIEIGIHTCRCSFEQ